MTFASGAGAAPPPALHVRLLGPAALRSGDGLPALLDSGRAASLLAYLIVHRGVPQPRGRLAFLLWPDSGEGQARTNLRKVLHTLRAALPDAERFLESTPATLRWREGAPCRVDLADFEQALAGGRLEEAVELYAGDLLEGSCDEWVLEERERLRDRCADALERLGQQHEEQEERAAAIRCAERLVRLDPLREAGHRALVRLHDTGGDRVRAMRAYHAYAGLAQRVLGLVPSAPMRAEYEALLFAGEDDAPAPAPGAATVSGAHGRAGPARAAEPVEAAHDRRAGRSRAAGPVEAAHDGRAGHGRAAGPAGPPLIGRARERAWLSERRRSAAGGRAQLALVAGEPGIGKSRLVEELRRHCAHEGVLTAEARAYAAEGAVAYEPVVAWLRAGALAAPLRRLDRAHLAELSRLLPELRSERPDLPPPEPLPEAEQRRRLFAALAAALLAAGAPLLLVADDLQWFDRPTLQFLHYLLRAEAAAPVLVAATVRKEELDPGHPVGELTAGLQALGRCAELELGRLSRAETQMLAARLAEAPLGEADVERLVADSEGNPLFLVEAVRDGGVASGGRVQAVIAARLARLSAPAGELAGVAAAIGRDFSAAVLADASGLREPAFVAGLDELWQRGIVRAGAGDAYDFSHGRIREAAYAALGPAARRRHHLRVAGALERSHAGDLDAASGLIAAQYEAAQASAEAVGWHVRAAAAAQRLHDHAGAAHALEHALALNRSMPAGRDRDARELEILTALPAPLNALDGYRSERLDGVHERAVALAAKLGAEPAAPLVRSLAVAALTRGDFGAASAAGAQLRARGKRDADAVLAIEGEWVLAIAAYWQGDLLPARAHLEAALARRRPEHRAEHLLRYGQDTALACRIRLAHTLWLLGEHEEAARARDAAVAEADAREDAHSRSLVRVWAALIALDARDEAGLREHARALAGHAGGPAARAAAALAGVVEVLDGDAAAGLDRVRRAVDAGERGGPAAPGEQGLLARVLVEACALAGEAAAGLAAADRALATSNGAQPWGAEIRHRRGDFIAALDGAAV